MARYGIICDSCNYEDELFMPMRLWSKDAIGLCPKCGEPMRRDWQDGGKIDVQSKGRFGFVTNNMGDGPQYVHDYGDLKKKLKARGLHVTETDREIAYRGKHMKDLG
jgi:predicted nucleic acid-binding Zn ribbon protein